MAGNPLESLMSVSANHQLVSNSAAQPWRQQPGRGGGPASPHRQSTRRKWAQSVFGSRLNSGSCGESAVRSGTMRGQHSPENAARERSRVRNLRQAFHSLQAALPSVPPDTKLSKLDILVLATNYIAFLTETLDQGRTQAEHTFPSQPGGNLHPVKEKVDYCNGSGPSLGL
ncbi:transcription factor 23-like isoform X2 [Trematomus bernacchii]|uniref:transcription factor 23-like isoform X2 n=1 Tax=Trematomus bernacchii TaxID=40690 RepID=UPI00146CACDE|nr:transcription factor 23-like isoform X2 [Trematomus bernacchii]